MNKNYYDILEVSKTATDVEIKKAYKKLAMQYHPDRNQGNATAEKKFKEINESYQVLSDKTKKQNYDQFGSADANAFGGGGGFKSSGTGDFSGGFEDIFSAFGGGAGGNRGFEFDIGDLFGNNGKTGRTQTKSQKEPPKEVENLDVIETIEIPFLDFLYDTSLSVQTVYGKGLSLKVKAGTKPGTKFKISGKGRTSSGKTGDMYVIVEAKMPKDISPQAMKMIDAIRYQI